jgi:hypothetical protein
MISRLHLKFCFISIVAGLAAGANLMLANEFLFGATNLNEEMYQYKRLAFGLAAGLSTMGMFSFCEKSFGEKSDKAPDVEPSNNVPRNQ